MKIFWKEALAALSVTLALEGVSFFAAGLLVKIVTALCGVRFSWPLAAVAWLALLLAVLGLLVRHDTRAGSRRDDRRR